MKRILLFFFVSFYAFQIHSQSNKNWISDLDTLQDHFLQKDYLFVKISKKEFEKNIQTLKKSDSLSLEQKYWKINQLLKTFKLPLLSLEKIKFKRLPFEIKQFKNNYYITGIQSNYDTVLGYKLLKINSIPIKRILKEDNNINYLNIKSYLKKNDIIVNNKLILNLLSKNDMKIDVDLNLNHEELIKIIPKKTPFYLQKRDRWFWMYGINFGQQIYFKYNMGLSNEFMDKTMDSLQLTEVQIAKQYHLPLQTIYDAPTFDDFTYQLIKKFKKRRYKKLFIDFRNLTTGNALAFKNFINKIKKLRRINKKNRLFVFIDSNLSNAALETVLLIKKETKALIIGGKNIGYAISSDKIERFDLPNSEFSISYPKKTFNIVILEPDIEVNPTFSHYINGIDPIMQKVLSL